jgi:hypothetical protein
MFLSHEQSYFGDSIAFMLSVIPVGLLLFIIIASLVESKRRSLRTVLTARNEYFHHRT